MKIKTIAAALVTSATLFSPIASADDTQLLLNAFHEYGITKCDSFIAENSALKGNWNYFINKHSGGIDGPATEVTVTQIYGSKDDTVKTEDTYIQTAKNVFSAPHGRLPFLVHAQKVLTVTLGTYLPKCQTKTTPHTKMPVV